MANVIGKHIPQMHAGARGIGPAPHINTATTHGGDDVTVGCQGPLLVLVRRVLVVGVALRDLDLSVILK
jgi:hypothetical protein